MGVFFEACCWPGTVESVQVLVKRESILRQAVNMPVSSLKAAGLSWSMEASMSIGVRHF